MNMLKTMALTASFLIPMMGHAVQYKFVAMDSSVATKMCITSAMNDLRKLKTQVKIFERNNKRGVANGYVCNDMSIAQFSSKYGAYKTASYLNKFARDKNKANLTSVEIRDLSASVNPNKPIVVYVGNAPE